MQQGLQFKGQDDIATKVLATTLGMIAEIEREFISQRTKNALAKLKADGKKLGRPKGRAKNYKLDKYRNDIISYLEKGLNKTAIAKLIGVSVPTLNAFLKREGL
ncbi:TPA: recombinase family protein [Campylobacter coli]|nr:recombinase family protein [Campylobacter coli]HEG0293234.1 recombinase family protein [Campylobacter coli]